MNRLLQITAFSGFIVAILSPLILPTPAIVIMLHSLSWLILLLVSLERRKIEILLSMLAKSSNIETSQNLHEMAKKISADFLKKYESLVPRFIHSKLSSRDELSRSLQQIVSLAYKLLDAESAEVSLFDKEVGMYLSSFLIGKPLKGSAQAMLSRAIEKDIGEEEDVPGVLVHPIAFAGTVLGSLRVAFRDGRKPNQSESEVMELLSLQSSIAIINSQYTQELLRMKRLSDETVRAKTGFLANLSHEIRGPLGIMLNATELVYEGLCGPITDDQKETLEMLRQNGRHLLELINDVLDYAKAESGKVSVNKEDIAVDEFLRDICKVVRVQAESKKHKLTQRQNAEMLFISCDNRHLRQILINILTNAIKYTPEGGEIDVFAERTPAGKVKINVKDSGIGIDSSQRSKVFGAFERVEHSYSMKQTGTGLGMSLTRRLVELNGGVIDFSSSAGHGSHFWLLFDAQDPENTVTSSQSTDKITEVVSGIGKTILMVSKRSQESKTIARYLAKYGFPLAYAEDSEESLKIMHNETIRLVLIDNSSLDTSSDELIRKIRDDSSSSNTPIVLLSSRAFEFDVEKYLRMGVDRCITTPVELNVITKICHEVIVTTERRPEKRISTILSRQEITDVVH